MDEAALRELLDAVTTGAVSADDAVASLRRLPYADLGFARVDHHRALRQGRAETVYAPGKSPEQGAAIVAELLAQPGSTPILLSRADAEQAAAALAANPDGTVVEAGGGDPEARRLHTVVWRAAAERPERVAVVTAGTADLPVADECAATLAAHGLRPVRISDVGVAGLHRILDAADELADADFVVVVAGMEGALASVVGGLTAAPVVAVPTSVGYGSSLEGVTAPARHARLVRVRSHRRRHRQRLRGRVRGAAQPRRPPFGAHRCLSPRPTTCTRTRTRIRTTLRSSATLLAPTAPGRGSPPLRARPWRGTASPCPPPRGADATVAWFHCFSGIAGDMALGALLDAGADLHEVRTLLKRLPVGGWEIETETVLRSGIGGTKVHVRTEAGPPARSAREVAAMVAGAGLPDRVRRRALATFRALAEAEGRLHRVDPAAVHLHEVGALDAIVDVVGTCAALELLGVDEVTSSPVADGLGTVRAAHGVLPVPVPAVVELLTGAPTYGLDIARELTTPTGAALLAANVVEWGPMPAMVVGATGFGAGSADLGDRPNLTRVVVGRRSDPAGRVPGQAVVLLEANVDDVTGETLAHAVDALLEAGAHDAWVTPIVMKKGRPAHTVGVLVDPALAAAVRAVLVRETGTMGVRGSTIERWPQRRSFDEVTLDGHTVRVKVTAGRVKAEHDDAARAARALGLPLREVAARAEAAWRTLHP